MIISKFWVIGLVCSESVWWGCDGGVLGCVVSMLGYLEECCGCWGRDVGKIYPLVTLFHHLILILSAESAEFSAILDCQFYHENRSRLIEVCLSLFGNQAESYPKHYTLDPTCNPWYSIWFLKKVDMDILEFSKACSHGVHRYLPGICPWISLRVVRLDASKGCAPGIIPGPSLPLDSSQGSSLVVYT